MTVHFADSVHVEMIETYIIVRACPQTDESVIEGRILFVDVKGVVHVYLHASSLNDHFQAVPCSRIDPQGSIAEVRILVIEFPQLDGTGRVDPRSIAFKAIRSDVRVAHIPDQACFSAVIDANVAFQGVLRAACLLSEHGLCKDSR